MFESVLLRAERTKGRIGCGLRMWIGAREGRRMAVFGDWLVASSRALPWAILAPSQSSPGLEPNPNSTQRFHPPRPVHNPAIELREHERDYDLSFMGVSVHARVDV